MADIVEQDLVVLAGDIVAAFVTKNAVHIADLPQIIQAVHATLKGLAAPQPVAPVLSPAVPVRKSVTDEYLVCLEDGKKFKSLKRHLQQAFGLSPDAYRTKWNLPRDYPMVAPAYAAKRSLLAKESGLGSERRAAGQRAADAPPAPSGETRSAGRRAKPAA